MPSDMGHFGGIKKTSFRLSRLTRLQLEDVVWTFFEGFEI